MKRATVDCKGDAPSPAPILCLPCRRCQCRPHRRQVEQARAGAVYQSSMVSTGVLEFPRHAAYFGVRLVCSNYEPSPTRLFRMHPLMEDPVEAPKRSTFPNTQSLHNDRRSLELAQMSLWFFLRPSVSPGDCSQSAPRFDSQGDAVR